MTQQLNDLNIFVSVCVCVCTHWPFLLKYRHKSCRLCFLMLLDHVIILSCVNKVRRKPWLLNICICIFLQFFSRSVLQFLARSASQDLALTLCFTVPTVTALTSLLRQGEGRIANPQHVTLVLGALQSLPLDHRNPNVYHSAFLAVHEALFAIIKCHPQVDGHKTLCLLTLRNKTSYQVDLDNMA